MVVNIYRTKLAIIGDQAVGKTALSQVFVSNGVNYPKNYNMTFGADVNAKVISIPNTDDAVELLIYDSPGIEAYTEYLDRFWNKPEVLMIVYDVTRSKTFDSVQYWYRRACEAEWRTNNGKPLATVLFANKCETTNRSAVTTDVAQEFAIANDMKLFTGSAKENRGIEDAMKYLAEEFYSAVEKRPSTSLKEWKSGDAFQTALVGKLKGLEGAMVRLKEGA